MAYADAIRTASATFESVATLIEGQLARLYTDTVSHGSPISTTSTSFTDYTDIAITQTTATGDIVLAFSSVYVSHGTSAAKVLTTINMDGSDLTLTSNPYWISSRADTGGLDDTPFCLGYIAPSAGSHTFKVRWRVESGTGYSKGANLFLLVLKNS